MVRTLLFLVFLLVSAPYVFAGGQTVIPNYATAQRQFFWTNLCPKGGHDLYCNVRFTVKSRLTIEHVYAADWMATHHGCRNCKECFIPAYRFAEADLHNLWPAIGAINSSRGDKLFGEIPGNKFTLPPSVSDLKCAYKQTTGQSAIVEPRDTVKGEIARSLFYMHVEYGLDLKGMAPMLKRWNVSDPPDQAERVRNGFIEKLQGTRNRFIDKPCLAGSWKGRTKKYSGNTPMRRSSFTSLLNQIARDAARQQRQAEAERRRNLRNQIQAARAVERRRSLEAKEAKQQYVESRIAEAQDATQELQDKIAEFEHILEHTLSIDDTRLSKRTQQVSRFPTGSFYHLRIPAAVKGIVLALNQAAWILWEDVPTTQDTI